MISVTYETFSCMRCAALHNGVCNLGEIVQKGAYYSSGLNSLVLEFCAAHAKLHKVHKW